MMAVNAAVPPFRPPSLAAGEKTSGLPASGSTAGSEGIQLAYQVAQENFNSLIFAPADKPAPTKRGGRLDWSKVKRITILEVTNVL